ncbi:MAG: hypothetical protein KatS3mg068_0043 [Candidatus Sericytochromatia bacterium]|nr:MAG: hypothetical protein KatS3mg068_0043 [Candidatus Sericytochromatia bacterium]
MFVNWEELRRRNKIPLFFDLFMISLAILNILLVLFDFTYFYFRDFYFHNLNFITKIYDPIKGVEKHRDTEKIILLAETFFSNIENTKNEKLKNELVNICLEMIEKDFFSRANKSGSLEVIKNKIRKYENEESSKKAFKKFWNNTSIINFEKNKKFFFKEIYPILQTNYWRGYDERGKYIDYFYYIDSIFVLIFILEFIFQWILAIKRNGNDEKILYPLYHWYDILGLIPLKEFRILRLFRILSVYIRLVNTNIIIIKDNPIYKRISKIKRIITEEISDQVSINILTDIQEKTKLGANRDLIAQTIKAHKEEIKHVLKENIVKLEKRIIQENHSKIVSFISNIILDSIENNSQYKKIEKIPYINQKIKEVINYSSIKNYIDEILKNSSNSFNKLITSKEGDDLLNNIIDDFIDEIIIILNDKKIQDLIENINLKVLEELKKGNKLKKWKIIN